MVIVVLSIISSMFFYDYFFWRSNQPCFIMMKTTAVRHTFIMLLVLAIQSAQCHQHKYNVVNFHAAADGKTDDSQVTAANANFFLKVATTPKKFALLLVFLISLSVVFAAKRHSWRHGRRLAAIRPGQSWSYREEGHSCWARSHFRVPASHRSPYR